MEREVKQDLKITFFNRYVPRQQLWITTDAWCSMMEMKIATATRRLLFSELMMS